MVGSYNVRVSRRRGVSFRFTIRRNITVVRGDSGTGKTTLFEMVSDHMREGAKSGVTIQCDHPCVALVDMDWENQLAGMKNSIVFVDEGFQAIRSDEFARAVKHSGNYFVLFTREVLANLPYSVDEIYRIKTSGKYHTLVPLYKHDDAHRYYEQLRAKPKRDFDLLVTEDSKAGFQFLMPDSKRVMFRFSPRARTQRCLNGSIGTKAIVSLSSPMAPPLVRMRTGCLRFSISIGTLWRCACRNRSNGSCSNLGS